MSINSTFQLAYQDLERRMASQATADGAYFLPNLAPHEPVDFALVCMEPSAGRWATSPEAASRVAAGFRNFLSTTEDFLVHFSATHYLCQNRETYHITDLSKGAMPVKSAGIARTKRYDRWYHLLLEELRLILRPGAFVVAVGNPVARQFHQNSFPWPFARVIHYSGQAAAARRAGIAGRRHEFDNFASSVSLQDIIQNATLLLAKAGMPQDGRAAILARLARANLSLSRKELIFNYKIAFEAIRERRDVGRAV